jgi:histidine triad (HIT) family protein
VPSIFSKIISGQIPSYKIAENQYCFAFLDISPLKKGHTLVVPKVEVDNILQLDSKNFSELFSFSKIIAVAIQKSIPCNRVSFHVIGLEVPHAHIHLIPINSANDCNFQNEKLKFTTSEFEETIQLITKELLL